MIDSLRFLTKSSFLLNYNNLLNQKLSKIVYSCKFRQLHNPTFETLFQSIIYPELCKWLNSKQKRLNDCLNFDLFCSQSTLIRLSGHTSPLPQMCETRYTRNNVLCKQWTATELSLLKEVARSMKRDWTAITEYYFPGRNVNQVKCKYSYVLRGERSRESFTAYEDFIQRREDMYHFIVFEWNSFIE